MNEVEDLKRRVEQLEEENRELKEEIKKIWHRLNMIVCAL
jgi:uncharacterized protein (UPF0335 family)